MSERHITPRTFLKKANSLKISAEVFLQTHRNFLTTGKLGELTSPILAKFDSKEILPSPCLEAISSVVLKYILDQEQQKGEKALLSSEPKQYEGTVYDAEGRVCTAVNEHGEDKELVLLSDDGGAIERWLNRRLFDQGPGAYGIIVNHKMLDKEGKFYQVIIQRDDAVWAILRPKKMGAMKRMASKSAPLGWKPKVQGDRFYFSRG